MSSAIDHAASRVTDDAGTIAVRVTLVAMLLGALVASGLLLAVRWGMTHGATPRDGGGSAPTLELLIGFVTNFFDTLGIGSFATDHDGLSAASAWCPTS